VLVWRSAFHLLHSNSNPCMSSEIMELLTVKDEATVDVVAPALRRPISIMSMNSSFACRAVAS
jgi:hypothetical protein